MSAFGKAPPAAGSGFKSAFGAPAASPFKTSMSGAAAPAGGGALKGAFGKAPAAAPQAAADSTVTPAPAASAFGKVPAGSSAFGKAPAGGSAFKSAFGAKPAEPGASASFLTKPAAGGSNAFVGNAVSAPAQDDAANDKNAVKTRAPNEWVEFEKAHKGMRLNSTQLSEMYHAQKKEKQEAAAAAAAAAPAPKPVASSAFGAGFGKKPAASATAPEPAAPAKAAGFGFGAARAPSASKAAKELARLTGLTIEAATACSTKFDDDMLTALASVVQSLPKLPAGVFADPTVIRQAANTAQINEMLRKAYDAVRAVMAAKSIADEAEAWRQLRGYNWDSAKLLGVESADKAEAPVAKQRIVGTPVPPDGHFTGPMIDMPNFWEQEVVAKCTLFVKNQGFLERNKDTLRARLLKWVEKAGKFHSEPPVLYVPITDRDEETARVIIKDAVRTFFEDEHREKFSVFLHSMYHELGSYGQAMSYVAGLCMIVLNEHETAAVLRKCAKEYIQGHWAAEAVGFATNAWLVESVMHDLFPDVAKHFQKINFWPDTYLQKILSGLCVHVLTFDLLFEFLDNFMQQGFPFLVRFVMALIAHFQTRLLALNDTKINELFEIMRLDLTAVSDSDHIAILRAAPEFDLGTTLDDIDKRRMVAYDTKVAPRLKKAPKEEAFEPCQLCEKDRPKWFCEECGTICEACKKGNKYTHTADHDVSAY